MNAVEIEEAISNLAAAPFAPEEFAFAFLEAFGNKPTTLKRLRTSNRSDVGGVLQTNNIHIKDDPREQIRHARLIDSVKMLYTWDAWLSSNHITATGLNFGYGQARRRSCA